MNCQISRKLSRRQSIISDFKNGKIEIGILALVQIAIVFGKPISCFIHDMAFLVSISDIHNKRQEEELGLFREIEFVGDPQLALRLLKSLDDYFIETQDQE